MKHHKSIIMALIFVSAAFSLDVTISKYSGKVIGGSTYNLYQIPIKNPSSDTLYFDSVIVNTDSNDTRYVSMIIPTAYSPAYRGIQMYFFVYEKDIYGKFHRVQINKDSFTARKVFILPNEEFKITELYVMKTNPACVGSNSNRSNKDNDTVNVNIMLYISGKKYEVNFSEVAIEPCRTSINNHKNANGKTNSQFNVDILGRHQRNNFTNNIFFKGVKYLNMNKI